MIVKMMIYLLPALIVLFFILKFSFKPIGKKVKTEVIELKKRIGGNDDEQR